MAYDDVITRNDDGELAVRTVSVSEGNAPTNYDDVMTRDENGNLAVRVIGNGGGDQHNLGYYATQAALEEAHPTAEAGDWAIVGATDTVWIWDEDTSAWVDSDQKGQVTSVNNQTGAVTIGADDILPSQTGYSGRVLGTDGFVAGWVKPEIVQRSTMPQASEDELGNIYQFTGTTDANYTNGYFYKCVSDGGNPATYSWSQVSVQPTPSGLPSQTGQSGKFLTTDGTDASWSDTPLVNQRPALDRSIIVQDGYSSRAGDRSIAIGGNTQTSGSSDFVRIGSGNAATGGSHSVVIGCAAENSGTEVKTHSCVIIGYSAETIYNSTTPNAIAIGRDAQVGGNAAIAIGYLTSAEAAGAIQLGSQGGNSASNSDANTFKVANANGNYEIMSADGTIPADRLTKSINKYSSMPTASVDNLGWIVQYIGTTDSTYTHGYIYENIATTTESSATASQTTGSSLTDVAVVVATFETQITTSGSYVFTSDGADWSYDGNVVDLTDYGITYTGTPVADDAITVVYTEESTSYAWTRVDVQPAGSSLPSQTGQNGKFLTTDGTDASWSDKPLVNAATGSSSITIGGVGTSQAYAINIGAASQAQGNDVSIGWNSTAFGSNSIAIGSSTQVISGSNTIAIGSNVRAGATNAIQLGGVWPHNNTDANTFKVGNENGNFEMMSADGTVPHARLTNAVVSNAITIAVADWNGGTTCTKTVSGLTATSVVWVAPDNASQSDYLTAGVYASAQTTDTITFTCTTTPTSSLTVNVIYC